MASSSSSSPAKSLPFQLHNFELPDLWNKDGLSIGLKKGRRSIMMSPSQRQKASPASRLTRPQSRSTDPATLSSRVSQVPGVMKQLPVNGESSNASCVKEEVKNLTAGGESEKLSLLQPRESSFKTSLNREAFKNSPVGGGSKKHSLLRRWESTKPSLIREELETPPAGGDDSEKLSSIRDEARRFRRRESESSKKGKVGVIEQHRNHSTNDAFSLSPSNDVGSAFKSEQIVKKYERRSMPAEDDDEAANKKAKIKIKIHGEVQGRVMKKESNGEADPIQEEGNIVDDFEDDVKICDLMRLRKLKGKSHKATVSGDKGGASLLPEKNKHQPQTNANKSAVKEGKSGGDSGSGKKEKSEKKQEKCVKEKKIVSLSIALTKKEIEEDIYAMTGRRPAKRPQRRPKNVQKQLDQVFPGQWLVSITQDSYKVSLNSMKGN